MKDEIIDTVVKVMLPLGEGIAAKNALNETNKIIFKLVTPSPGKMAVELSSNVARRMLKDVLAQTNYIPMPGTEGTLRDLKSNERLNLVIGTSVGLVFGHMQWRQKQVQSILDVWPAQEFYRAYPRVNERNWPEQWKAAGGQFFPGKSSYPEGRMVALKNDAIWTTISAFGMPFCPFDLGSGMDVRDVSRNEALELGVMKINHPIQPAALSASNEFQESLAIKLRENLAKLEADEERELDE